jgi:hypothetical protein
MADNSVENKELGSRQTTKKGRKLLGFVLSLIGTNVRVVCGALIVEIVAQDRRAELEEPEFDCLQGTSAPVGAFSPV